MKFEKILSAVPNLSQKQLRQLRARIDLLTKSPSYDGEEQLFLDAINRVVKSYAGGAMPMSVMVKQTYAPKFRSGAHAADEFISEHIKPEDRLQRRAAMLLIVRAASCFLDSRSIPVKHRTLVDQLESPAAMMDHAFPGYARAGLLRMVRKRMVTTNRLRKRLTK